MYGVELYDGETARFEVELSEDDVHGQWKLKGEVLSHSPVKPLTKNNTKNFLTGVRVMCIIHVISIALGCRNY